MIQAVTILKFQISAYKQHCSWIAEFMKNFITINIWSVLAYDKDHDGDGVVLFFCLLQECSCATWETLVLAAEALHHISLDFQTSLKMSRASLPSVSSTSKSSLESVAKFLILIFDQDSRGSWRVFAEKKCLQIMDWSKIIAKAVWWWSWLDHDVSEVYILAFSIIHQHVAVFVACFSHKSSF